MNYNHQNDRLSTFMSGVEFAEIGRHHDLSSRASSTKHSQLVERSMPIDETFAKSMLETDLNHPSLHDISEDQLIASLDEVLFGNEVSSLPILNQKHDGNLNIQPEKDFSLSASGRTHDTGGTFPLMSSN